MGVLCADAVGSGGGPAPPPPTCCADPVDTIVAASPSRLVDIDTTSTTDFPDGIAVWVRSVEDYFILNRTTALTADGITVADPLVGGGQWLRRNVPSQRWLRQATWFIDSVSGDDENVGDVIGSPLRTHAELERRAFGHGVELRQDTTVEIAFPGLPSTDRIRIDVKMPLGFSLVYNGVPDPVPVRSGTLSGATATDPSTQTQQIIEDAVGGGWAAEVGFRVRITSGPRTGALAWIGANLDPGVPDSARTSPFATFTLGGFPLIVRPAAGDDYVVENLPTVFFESVHMAPGDTLAAPGFGVVFNNLVCSTSESLSFLPLPAGPFEFCTFIGCGFILFVAHDFMGIIGISQIAAAFFLKSEVVMLSDLFLSPFPGGPGGIFQNSRLAFGAECYAQSSPLLQRGTPFTAVSGFLGSAGCSVTFVNVGGEPSIAACSVFDSTTAGIAVSEDVTITIRAPVFGDGNTDVGFLVTGKVWYQPDGPGAETFKPTITGAVGDTRVGGILKAYADIPFFNASNGAQLTEMAETP